MKTIRIDKLQIDGPGKAPAIVEFHAGLNAVVGASDTGKSYIFHAIDYLLGASTPPSENPNSAGYNRGWLQLGLDAGKLLTVERVFGEQSSTFTT